MNFKSREIADPQRLKYLDKSFAVNTLVREQYQRASAVPPLPAVLGTRAGENSDSIPVRIGDDIAGALRKSKVRDIVLRLQTSGAVHDDALAVTFNDAPTKARAGQRR